MKIFGRNQPCYNTGHMDEQIRNALTEKQLAGYEAAMQGFNLFITGSGGTGKSLLLQCIIDELVSMEKNIIVCAPTGIAASTIGGATIHRAFGFEPGATLTQDNRLQRRTPRPVMEADVVIIDEISMVRADLFDAIIYSLVEAEKESKKRKQVIVCGDFLQLPPFYDSSTNEQKAIEGHYGRKLPVPWAFLGNYWSKCNFKRIVLDEVMRQTDSEHVGYLDMARVGDVGCIGYFNRNSSPQPFKDSVTLFTKRINVDIENNTQIKAIPGEPYTYMNYYTGVSLLQSEKEEMVRAFILKDGCRVMMTANDSPNNKFSSNVFDDLFGVEKRNRQKNQFHNGSLGTVMSCYWDSDNHENDFIMVILDGRTDPIKVTRKKSYVYSYDFSEKSGKVVRKKIGTRRAFPLVPAYAMTVHKAQGQTYDTMNFDPSGCFASGQLYVALSRVKTVGGLHLLGGKISTDDLKTDPEALAFCRSLKDDSSQFMAGKRGPKPVLKGIEDVKTGRQGGRPARYKGKGTSLYMPSELAELLDVVLKEAFPPADSDSKPNKDRYNKLMRHLKNSAKGN